MADQFSLSPRGKRLSAALKANPAEFSADDAERLRKALSKTREPIRKYLWSSDPAMHHAAMMALIEKSAILADLDRVHPEKLSFSRNRKK